jgi:dsRNA-specific ribonuclease
VENFEDRKLSHRFSRLVNGAQYGHGWDGYKDAAMETAAEKALAKLCAEYQSDYVSPVNS